MRTRRAASLEPQSVVAVNPNHEDSDSDAAPEEVPTRTVGKDVALVTRRRETAAVKTTRDALRNANRARDVELKQRAKSKILNSDITGRKSAASAAAAAVGDDLEELDEEVLAYVAATENKTLENESSDEEEEEEDDEREAYEAYERGEHMNGGRMKRKTWKRDGFDVVALDVEGHEVDGVEEARSMKAMDFMRERLINKHARSGEMLRDSRTGKIRNNFAQR
jgi:hypothetical protein